MTDTKNGDARTLPIAGKALEALRDLNLQNSARSQYVFPALSGLDEPYENFDGYWYDALTFNSEYFSRRCKLTPRRTPGDSRLRGPLLKAAKGETGKAHPFAGDRERGCKTCPPAEAFNGLTH